MSFRIFATELRPLDLTFIGEDSHFSASVHKQEGRHANRMGKALPKLKGDLTHYGIFPSSAARICFIERTDDEKRHEASKWNAPHMVAISFAQHLYYPRLSPIKDAVVPLRMRPLALGEPSEVQFVEDVMAFYDSPAGKDRLRGFSLYLLRNADNRAKGLGCALAGNFYPDFLLWLVDDKTSKQWLSFIDPKGIRNLNISDPKSGLHKEIKQIEKQLGDGMISLNSFILSVTTFNDLLNVTGSTTKSDLEDRNVLFMDHGGPTYLDKLLVNALA